LSSSRAYIGLGSNQGDRLQLINAAADRLSELLDGLECSPLYETDPQEVTDQPLFLNAVLSGVTDASARELLAHLHDVERDLGRAREREQHKGPRGIDLDLLLFGDRVVGHDSGDDAANHRHAGPVVPHPTMHRRAFVLIPLLDLAPESRDPRDGTPFHAYLEALPPQGVYYYGTCSYTTV